MRIRFVVLFLILSVLCYPRVSAAAASTADEIAAARQWTEAAFGATVPNIFSFSYEGKASHDVLAGLALKQDSRALDDRRTERTLTWTDPKTGFEVRCISVAYSDYPAVEWTVYLRNGGAADTPLIENIQSLDARWERPEGGEFVLHGIKGDFCAPDSYEPYETTLAPDTTQKFAPDGGRPTNRAFPYYNLTMPGSGIIIAVGWSGQWATSFVRDNARGIQIVAGQELTHLRLKPGEEIRTPRIVLLFWKGADVARAQNLWRRWMRVHNSPRPGGKLMEPTLMMCTSDFYPGMKSNAADEIKYVDAYLNAGVKLDYWWIDAGWYPCKKDWGETGTWEPDPERYPRGIREVSDYVHSKGMKQVVWFEPERVTPNTWLSNQHSEWVLGGKAGLLNLGNPEARQWLTDHIDRLLTEQGIDLYRQDFNMDPLRYWRDADASDRQGITENFHVQGYLAYWDELFRRHPNMPIDSCASGGRRNDIDTLRRASPLLRSDYRSDPIYTQQCHLYGLAQWVPYFGTGVPDKDDYTVRSFWCPWFAIGRPEPRREGLDWKAYLRMVAEWRRGCACLLDDFYPLTPYSLDDNVWMAWQFDSPERGEGFVQVFRRSQCKDDSFHAILHALDPDAVYTLTNFDVPGTTEATGRELIEQGVSITLKDHPSSAVILYRRKS